MSKFNKHTPRVPLGTQATNRTVTNHEGATAFGLDLKSELFSLAVTNMVGEDTFYESAESRDNRYLALVRTAALQDFDWLTRMLLWLRRDGNMRSASLVGAAEAVAARLHDGLFTGNRELIDGVLLRADEPGEMLGYWHAQYDDSSPKNAARFPKPIKKGVADAVTRLYSEKSFVKYEAGGTKGFRFGDVIQLVHPTAKAPWQDDLFTHAMTFRYGNDRPTSERLTLLRDREVLLALPVEERRKVVESADGMDRLFAAGFTWESLAPWLQGPMDAKAWAAILPSMGYMARLRNLRNFEKAGLDRKAIRGLCDYLADPAQVARSRQMPFRFLSAYRNTESDHWKQALNDALETSVQNIPDLGGHTLILVDTSASMTNHVSERSTIQHVDVAALFGVALAAKGEKVTLRGFASGEFDHPIKKGASVLRVCEDFCQRIGEVGHGTDIGGAVARSFRKGEHTRVVIISDMQTFGGRSYWMQGMETVPGSVPIFAFDTTGYGNTVVDTRQARRYQLGGLTDASFRTMAMVDRGVHGSWPWEDQD